jgi:hypothetical protein
MKLLFYVTLLFIISHVWYGESEADSHQCIANSLKENLTTKCNDAFCHEKSKRDFNNCIAANCKKYDCGGKDYLPGTKDFCHSIWGAYCCGTKFFARECSKKDQKVYKSFIKNTAKDLQSNICSLFPRKSFDCDKVFDK